MTLTMPSPMQATPEGGVGDAARPQRRANRVIPVLLQVVAMLGIGALLYPTASDWFATRDHNAEISGYVEHVETLPSATKSALLDQARSYNALLPQGPLSDPFGAAGAADPDAAYATYEQLLRVSDGGVIGDLVYARLGIGLPIYHGTSDAVLSRGAGHLYGSSLPVGGPSTHAVLTSHSGLARASLFTPLTRAQLGDIFIVDVLGEARYYEVDAIATVLPDDADALRIEPQADHVTLITCTPMGVNSHRLLVRGTRIDAPETADVVPMAGDGRHAGFPWWAVVFVAGSAVVAALLFAPGPRRRSSRPDERGRP